MGWLTDLFSAATTKLVDSVMFAHDKRAIEKYSNQICRLPAKGYGTTEFDMSNKRLKALLEAGREAM